MAVPLGPPLPGQTGPCSAAGRTAPTSCRAPWVGHGAGDWFQLIMRILWKIRGVNIFKSGGFLNMY